MTREETLKLSCELITHPVRGRNSDQLAQVLDHKQTVYYRPLENVNRKSNEFIYENINEKVNTTDGDPTKKHCFAVRKSTKERK